ncbi:beta strand repeat-containing protein, partial [Paraburkholderia silviterrae]
MSVNQSTKPSDKKLVKEGGKKAVGHDHGVADATHGAQNADLAQKHSQTALQLPAEHRHKHGDRVDVVKHHEADKDTPAVADDAHGAPATSAGADASANGATSTAGTAADGSADAGGTTDGSADSGAAASATPAASSGGVPTAVWVGLGALAIGGAAAALAAGGGGGGSSSSSSGGSGSTGSGSGGSNSTGSSGGSGATTVAGTVADGLISGAHIYIDVNGNGVPVAAGDTGVTTDANGHFTLQTSLKGAIIAVGGIDIDTGLPNTITLTAPAGSTVINPLTTLVQTYASAHGVTTAEAQTVIANGLGIASSISLTTYDPFSASANDTNALAVQKLAAQVAMILAVAQNSAAQANGASAASAILTALTNLIANAGSTPVDLSNSDTLNTLNSNAGNVLNAAEIHAVVNGNGAIQGASTLGSVSSAQGTTLGTPDETVAGALAVLAKDTASTVKFNLYDTSANLATVSSSLAGHVVNIVATDVATAAQASAIHALANSGTQTYSVADTAANLIAAGAAVTAAHSVTVTDPFVSVLVANTLIGLNAAIAITSIHDTASALLNAIAHHDAVLGDAGSLVTTDANAVALTVSAADTLAAAHVSITHGYTIADTVANLLAAIGNHDASLAAAGAIVTTDATAQPVSIAGVVALLGAHVSITHGYNLVDSTANLLAAIQHDGSLIGGAHAIATNDAAAVTLTVANADALANAHVTITNGYTIVDTEVNLLAAINREDASITNAHSLATNDVGAVTLSVANAHSLLGAHVTIAHGYTIVDSEANLLAAIHNEDASLANAHSIATNDGSVLTLNVADADAL